MQPSREREDVDDGAGRSVDDLLDDDLLDDDLLDDDAVDGGSSDGRTATGSEADVPPAGVDSAGEEGAPLIGMEGRLVSGKATLLALLLTAGGMFLGGAIPLVGGIGRFVGLFLAAFVVGLVASRRRYVETGLVGAGAGAASVLSGFSAPRSCR
ncbi:MAG: hypothetical protein V5A46_01490 [Haloferacaceae archaeon]